MLIMGILIGLTSTFIEAKLVNSWAWLRNIYENGLGPVPGSWVNTAGSFLLAALIGGGAGGVVALMGGLFATGFSGIFFPAQKALNNAGITVKGLREKLETWWSKNGEHFRNLGKTIMITIKVITFPLMLILKINTKINSRKEQIKNRTSKLNSGRTKETAATYF